MSKRCLLIMPFSGSGGRDQDYWFEGPNAEPGLNVDRLAEGVVNAINRLEACFTARAAAGAVTYTKFFEWLNKKH